MKVTTYRRDLVTREGLKVSINDAQAAELLRRMNEDSEGVLYVLVKAGVFVADSSPDARDDNPFITAIKALAKQL